MKGISLWQPWASLIGRGKEHETRHWQTSYRGPIAIHAAKQFARTLREVCLNDPICRTLEQYDLLRIVPAKTEGSDILQFEPARFEWRLPLGAIVATAVIVDCIPTEDCFTIDGRKIGSHQRYFVKALDYLFGDYSPGRFAWQLADIRILEKPIPFKGRQGLFEVPDELVRDAA